MFGVFFYLTQTGGKNKLPGGRFRACEGAKKRFWHDLRRFSHWLISVKEWWTMWTGRQTTDNPPVRLHLSVSGKTDWVYANGGADKIMMYRERRGVYIALVWCLFVVDWDFEEEMQALKASLELMVKKVEKVHLDSQKTRAKSPRLFQRMLWNLHSSDWKKRITSVWHMILIWSPLRKYTIWIRFESDKEKWEKMYPYPGHLSHLFSSMPGNRTVLTAIKGEGPRQLSFSRFHSGHASWFRRARCVSRGVTAAATWDISQNAPQNVFAFWLFRFFSHFSLWFFFGKFAFSQVSRQVASETTGTGSKMATVVMLWCDLWTKGHHVSEGSALACVRHFCDGEVGHTGILGVEILALCLSSKLCKLVFFGLETLTFWRSEKVKTFHIFSHHIWTESDIDLKFIYCL